MKEDYNFWLDEIATKEYPKLEKFEETDIVIVGGGITGITIAYLLSKENKKVILIEKEKIRGYVTEVSTGFLTEIIDTKYYHLIKSLGEKKARLISDSHKYAINKIEEIIKNENISCDFRRVSNYLFATNKKEKITLNKEIKYFNLLGIESEYLEDDELRFKNIGYIKIKNQATFHPIKYVLSLCEKAEKNGVRIFENTNAENFYKNSDGSYTLISNNKEIKTKNIIFATYNPFKEPLSLFFKKAKYVSYVAEYENKKDSFPDGLYEDSQNPYHYFRVINENEKCRIIFGGEDHRADIKINSIEKNYFLLDKHAKEILGNKITGKRKWAGSILESIDGLSFIGKLKNENLFYAFAFSGNGLTYSVIAGQIIKDKILSKKNIYEEIYNISRRISYRLLIYKGLDYFKILVGGAIYNFFKK